jgi:hypothetical protein
MVLILSKGTIYLKITAVKIIFIRILIPNLQVAS